MRRAELIERAWPRRSWVHGLILSLSIWASSQPRPVPSAWHRWRLAVYILACGHGGTRHQNSAMQPLQPHAISTSRRSILNGLSAAQKSPRLAPGALFSSRIRCLSPYRNGGGRDYQFHPDGIRTLEIRSLGRLAQGVDTVLLLSGGRVGETRQLEHDP